MISAINLIPWLDNIMKRTIELDKKTKIEL